MDFPSHALPFHLEQGGRLEAVSLAYETYGTLNATASNAVLVCHALTGDAHLAGQHHPNDKKQGWWHACVGKGKAFDPTQHFIICVNVLGGCQGSTGPASINPATGKPYGMAFPLITIGDMVEAQAWLLKQLGIQHLHAVVGGSMGGMQALEWACRYPEAVKHLVVLASTTKLSAQALAFNAVGRHAIMNDPTWLLGTYPPDQQPTGGLSTARMLAHITYLSQQGLEEKFGRNLQSPTSSKVTGMETGFAPQFAVESYLDYQGVSFLKRFDANTYLYLTKALDLFDIAQQWGQGDVQRAVARIQAKSLIIAFESDWLFTPAENKRLADALRRAGKQVSYAELPSTWGHDAFLLEHDAVNRSVAPFLALI